MAGHQEKGPGLLCTVPSPFSVCTATVGPDSTATSTDRAPCPSRQVGPVSVREVLCRPESEGIDLTCDSEGETDVPLSPTPLSRVHTDLTEPVQTAQPSTRTLSYGEGTQVRKRKRSSSPDSIKRDVASRRKRFFKNVPRWSKASARLSRLSTKVVAKSAIVNACHNVKCVNGNSSRCPGRGASRASIFSLARLDLESPPNNDLPQQSASATPCPQCKHPLPEDLPSRLLVREKIERCTVCARKKAEGLQKEWRERRYPDIDWDRLPARLEEYVPWLRECLQTREVPTFRTRYKEAKRSARFHEEIVSHPRCGYYGARGEDIMQNLILPLHDDLRSAQLRDPVIDSPSEYFTLVLAPAIFTKLIMIDMNQGWPAAVKTLKEGTSLGSRLYGD